MPHLTLIAGAAGAGAICWRLVKRDRAASRLISAPEPVAPREIGWSDVGETAAIVLEIGYALIGLIDERKGQPLMRASPDCGGNYRATLASCFRWSRLKTI